MKVLITGASGFIAEHLIKTLLRNDNVIIHALIHKHDKVFPSIVKKFTGDLNDPSSLKKVAEGVDIVFHLAAKTDNPSASEIDYYATNVEGTQNLLEACINARHFIYFSSVKAMVEETPITIDEGFPPNPTTSYGKTKLLAEQLVLKYGVKYGIKTTTLRLPMVYGAGNIGNTYKMIEAIDKNKFILIGNGGNIRSIVHVQNVVDAAINVIDKDKANGNAYIVTDGQDYSVREQYETIAKGLGKKPLKYNIPMSIARGLAFMGDIGSRIIRKPLPFNSEVMGKVTGSLTFSSNKITLDTGFVPKYNLYNTINETIKWYKGQSGS